MFKKQYTDDDIIKGCLENNRKFQELLYRKYFKAMMHMCLRYTSDKNHAIEVVNDGFLRVFQKLGQFENQGSFEGWIRRIVYHKMCDHFQKNNRYVRFMIFEEHDMASDDEVTSNVEYEDLLDMVKQLPQKTKQVFELFAIDGYKHEEIGQMLDMSESNSKWHLAQARKKLRTIIGASDQSINYESK